MPDAASGPLDTVTHFVFSITREAGIVINSTKLEHRKRIGLPDITQLIRGRAEALSLVHNHCTMLPLIGSCAQLAILGRCKIQKTFSEVHAWLRESTKKPSRILWAENNNDVIVMHK